MAQAGGEHWRRQAADTRAGRTHRRLGAGWSLLAARWSLIGDR